MIAMEIIVLSMLLVVGTGILIGNHYMEKAVHHDTQLDTPSPASEQQTA